MSNPHKKNTAQQINKTQPHTHMRNNQTETFLNKNNNNQTQISCSIRYTSLDYLALSSSAELLSAKRIAKIIGHSRIMCLCHCEKKNKQTNKCACVTTCLQHSLLYEYAKTNQIYKWSLRSKPWLLSYVINKMHSKKYNFCLPSKLKIQSNNSQSRPGKK